MIHRRAGGLAKMAHSYISCYIHYVFSTKGRMKVISPVLEEKLWPYMCGIARNNKMKALAVGGTEDHIHILISLPSTVSIAKAIQKIKGVSSKWVHETFPDSHDFNWQQGYGAFSVGMRHIDKTVAYINNQKEHHHRKTFKEKFIAFLNVSGMEYDEKYIWE